MNFFSQRRIEEERDQALVERDEGKTQMMAVINKVVKQLSDTVKLVQTLKITLSRKDEIIITMGSRVGDLTTANIRLDNENSDLRSILAEKDEQILNAQHSPSIPYASVYVMTRINNPSLGYGYSEGKLSEWSRTNREVIRTDDRGDFTYSERAWSAVHGINLYLHASNI